jgi:hypothetical protein
MPRRHERAGTRAARAHPTFKQAASDLERGLEDADCRGRDKPAKSHCK